jgi:hypothetical protein
MTHLCDLPPEIFERIGAGLNNAHLARALLTGDPRLVAKLFNIRNREYHCDDLLDEGVSNKQSSLVTAVLLGGAESVRTVWDNVERLLKVKWSSPYSIRRLDIRGSAYVSSVPASALLTDVLKRLPKLESLNFRHINFDGPLIVPSTVTSLSLGVIFKREHVIGIESLPLAHLGLTLKSSDQSDLEWIASASWYDTISSMSITGDCSNVAALAAFLPRNLHKLDIVRVADVHSRCDLGLLTSNQTRLERLTSGRNWWILSSLPATLTSLSVDRLVIDHERCADMITFFPPSLTSLALDDIQSSLSAEWTVAPPPLPDFAKVIDQIMPRLNLDSAIDLVRYCYESNVISDGMIVGESPAERCLIEKLAAAGYSARHLTWLSDARLRAKCSAIHDHDMGHVLDILDSSERDIGLFLKYKSGIESSRCCNGHYEQVVKCLEWGFQDHMALASTAPPELSDVAIGNLSRLIVRCDGADALKSFLGKYTFWGLKQIDFALQMTSQQPMTKSDIIRIIHSCRARLPALEVVDFWNWHVSVYPPDSEDVLLFREMRLQHVRNSSRFRYNVALPPCPPLPE